VKGATSSALVATFVFMRRKPKGATRRKPGKPTRRWSQHVTETSNAMDLEPGVFRKSSSRAIAASVKRSAERSSRRKADPYRSAMSMLTFYENRAGKNLGAFRRRKLDAAKRQLRALFGRD
jgi:hypothetical protein